jgi:hypothetical protein
LRNELFDKEEKILHYKSKVDKLKQDLAKLIADTAAAYSTTQTGNPLLTLEQTIKRVSLVGPRVSNSVRSVDPNDYIYVA